MTTSPDLVISGGTVVSPSGPQPADILIRDGRIEALVAQSQKRSAVYDVVSNPTNITVVVE